jgi:flagellar M-ring protein FliF
LRVRREVERHLETKAEDLLRAVVGEGNLSVRVSANLDFDQIERTVSSVDPEAQVILQEDRSEIVPGNEEQGAAQSITSTTYEPARSVESFNRSGARLDRLTVAVIVGHRLETGEDGEPVPVPRDPDEMAGIQELVGSAVGLVPDRGDVITVTNLPFIRTDPPAPPPAPPVGMLERIEEFQRPIVALLGILMALGMGLALLRTVSRTEASQQTLPGNEARAIAKGSPSDHPERDEDKTSTLPGGGEGAGQRGFREEASESPAPLARLAQIENPDLTARVVRTWMKEA